MDARKNRWKIFLVVAVGVFMSTLDSSMVNIALPSIMAELHSSLPLTQWIVMIYLLTITSTLLLWGHIADRVGRGRIYPMGMLFFGMASLGCALAPSVLWLIFWRLFQAIGAAMMMSSGPALIKDSSPPEQLGRSLGLVGVAVSVGLMAGPSLGGLIIEYLSWRAIFYLTVPIGLLFSAFALLVLPPPCTKEHTHRFDTVGGIAWTIALTLLVLVATIRSGTALFLLFVTIPILYFFLRHERRVSNPLLPMGLLAKKFFSAAVLSALLSFTVLFSVILLVPFYLDRITGLAPLKTGLVMMAIPLSVLLVAPAAGWLSDYVGARLLTTAGLVISTVGLILMTGLSVDSHPVTVAILLAILGGGQALFLSPNSASVLAHVDSTKAGVAAAMLATARNLGMLAGVAQAGVVFSFYFAMNTGGLDLKDFRPEHGAAFMTALRACFLFTAAIGIAGIIASWSRGRILARNDGGVEK